MMCIAKQINMSLTSKRNATKAVTAETWWADFQIIKQ